MGALTRGQRQTGGQNLFDPADNLESEYAKAALSTWFALLADGKLKSATLTDFQRRSGLKIVSEDGILEEDLPPIQRWLNAALAPTLEEDRDGRSTAARSRRPLHRDHASYLETLETGIAFWHQAGFAPPQFGKLTASDQLAGFVVDAVASALRITRPSSTGAFFPASSGPLHRNLTAAFPEAAQRAFSEGGLPC